METTQSQCPAPSAATAATKLDWTDPLAKRHPDAGGIALQVHGGGDHTKEFVRYRNIRVRRLDQSASGKTGSVQ